jgi:hypothetical protein
MALCRFGENLIGGYSGATRLGGVALVAALNYGQVAPEVEGSE